jgi:molybdate transport system substrate-binding protein
MAVASPSSAQVRVLISGGFSAAYQELLPQFEKRTGITVTTTRGASQGGPGPISIETELRGGLPADVVIMSREGLAELLAEGRIVIGSDVDLASVPLGVGVRVGTARPDISTVDAFKQTLLRAKSIGIQSTSGMYLKTKVFPQLGIADALACNRHPKLKTCNLGCRPRHRFVSAILGNSFATALVVAQI